MESKRVIQYLENNVIDKLISVPKSDLHNHAANGGNVKFIANLTDTKIEPSLLHKILNRWQR